MWCPLSFRKGHLSGQLLYAVYGGSQVSGWGVGMGWGGYVCMWVCGRCVSCITCCECVHVHMQVMCTNWVTVSQKHGRGCNCVGSPSCLPSLTVVHGV